MKSALIRIVSVAFLLFLLLLSPRVFAATEQRTALVVGNAAYPTGALKNPVNDATDMAAQLTKLGFKVTLLTNARLRQMDEAIEAFGRQLRQGGVGLFFYAGHGVRVKGANFLIPVDARINKETDLKYRALDANRVLDEMGNAKNGLNIVILDACRDNPFSRNYRSTTRGLAVVSSAPTGTYISYSTSPGNVAQDGKGRNSPYTSALLENMAQPGVGIEQVFKHVRVKLDGETRGKQVPWELSSLKGDFYFVPGGAGEKTAAAAPATLSAAPPPAAERKPETDRKAARTANTASTPPSLETTFISPTLGAAFVLVPAGNFTAGQPGGGEKQHQVTIGRPFYMQATEVTQAQWKKVMDGNPSRFGSFWAPCDSCPVEQVSWYDVQRFVRKLNSMEETDKYRLPTEAEWEYAARSGGKHAAYAGTNSDADRENYAWLASNADNTTHAAGLKKPNGFGLYDMSGNVSEWVSDWDGGYPAGPVTDPQGPTSGKKRVYRGSAWNDWPGNSDIANRGSAFPDFKIGSLGFRLVRSP